MLDLVADVRASTPTDAARRVVPDVARGAPAHRHGPDPRAGRLVAHCSTGSSSGSTPRAAARCSPTRVLVEGRGEAVEELLPGRAARSATASTAASDEIGHLRARVVSLSPAATLERGYAVVQLPGGCRGPRPGRRPSGTALRVRVAAGELRGDPEHVTPARPP